MGSRYGGLKQLDGLGPNGETIMDYSIYDAIKAGFGKLVFVIRKDFEEEFKEKIISKYEGHIPCEMVFQALDALPEGFTCPADRTKPWGTNHAVMMGAPVINEPFAVINCDDFYGSDSYRSMAQFLSSLPEGSKNRYAMVGFRVGNTLSENGTVARGICSKNEKGHLTTVVERTEIVRCAADGSNAGAASEPIRFKDEDGKWVEVADNTPVSMNMWGLPADFIGVLEERFPEFLKSIPEGDLKAEFLIPVIIGDLIQEGKADCVVLPTTDKWFGMTYKEDIPTVKDAFKDLVANGVYPENIK